MLATPDLTALTPIAQEFQALEHDVNAQLIEREEAVRACLVALLCGQHSVLFGPPGVAKSKVITLIVERLGLSRFATLCRRDMTQEDLTGPISLSGLQNDIYRRITTSRMPEAQVVFLDEVFNASTTAMHSWLTMMNERLYDNGGQRAGIPLISVFGATNRVPVEPETAAVYDRFQFRVWVDPVSAGNRPRMLQLMADQPSESLDRILRNNGHVRPTLALAATHIPQATLYDAMSIVADMPIPSEVHRGYEALMAELDNQQGITISDRRWTQSLDAIRASALLDGRLPDRDDLTVLKHCFWSTREQRDTVAGIVIKFANPLTAEAVAKEDEAKSIYDGIMASYRAGDTGVATAAVEGNERLKKLGDEVKLTYTKARDLGRRVDRITKAGKNMRRWQQEIAELVMGRTASNDPF